MRKRGTTTALGIVMISLGGLGLAVASLGILALATGTVEANTLLVADTALGLASKLGLIVCGVLILRRSTLAFPLTVATLCVSLVGSVTSYVASRGLQTVPPDAPEHVRNAAAVGHDVGFTCVTLLSVTLYVVAIVYLRRPATRAEFAGEAAEAGAGP